MGRETRMTDIINPNNRNNLSTELTSSLGTMTVNVSVVPSATLDETQNISKCFIKTKTNDDQDIITLMSLSTTPLNPLKTNKVFSKLETEATATYYKTEQQKLPLSSSTTSSSTPLLSSVALTSLSSQTTKFSSSQSSLSSSTKSSSILSTKKSVTTLPVSLSASSSIFSSSIDVAATTLKFMPTTTMNFYKRIAVFILVILEVLLVVPVNAGPVNVRHHRIQRDIYNDLENNRPTVSTQNETQQDGTCLLDGIVTKRATIHCETKPGCKAIQKTGYCCPEYQCECERDGKIYSNGETLPDQTQTPCKVCFCKGGEVVCTNVTCYKRDDCEPKYIPGRCCPEYDNCPPLEIGKSTTSKSITGIVHNIAGDTTDNYVQKFDQTSAASIKHIQQSHEMPLHNPLNITIKEITKVEEIRITDAPKPTILHSHTTPNPLSGTAINNKNGISSTQLTQVLAAAAAKDLQQQSLNSIEGKTLEDEIISPISTSGNGGGSTNGVESSSIHSSNNNNAAGENTKLTLVETKTILFPYNSDKISTTSIPPYSPPSQLYGTTDTTNKVVISDNNLLNGAESIKIVRHATQNRGDIGGGETLNLIQNNNGAGEKDRNFSQYEKNHEQAGEQVVIIDKNGQSKPITVFGIKGLQRGDVIEDPSLSSSVTNRFDSNLGKRKNKTKISSSKESYDSNESGDLDPIQASSSDDFVRFVIGSTTESSANEINNSSENYNDTKAGEDEIYEPVFYMEESDSSSVSPSSIEEIYEPVHYTQEPRENEALSNETNDDDLKIYEPVYHTSEKTVFEVFYYSPENDSKSTSEPENISSEPFPFEPEDDVDVNPAYPKLEDDLSLHREINGAADYLEHTELKSLTHSSHIKEEPRSVIDSLPLENPAILSGELKSSIGDSTTESTQSNQIDSLLSSSTPENDVFFDNIISEAASNPEARVPGEPCLVPEWERVNGTGQSRCNQTTVSNDSSLEDYGIMGLSLLKGNDSWPTSSEIDGMEFGSGSGMGSGMGISYSASANLIDNREPTTPNPNKIIDIDDIDGGSGSVSGNGTNSLRNDPKHDAESLKLDEDDNTNSSGSGLGVTGSDIAEEINKKTLKSFYGGVDSFNFF